MRSLLALGPFGLSWICLFCFVGSSIAQDWNGFSIPSNLDASKQWVLDATLSDQFNYNGQTSSGQTEFASRWRDSKPDGWLGPGATYFSPNNYSVANGSLKIFGSRVPVANQIPSNDPGFTRTTYTSYITSHATLGPGSYTEVMMKGGATQLSSNFWLLDDNNETEIDVVEVYGDGTWFPRNPATNVHFFKRDGNGGGNFNNQAHHPNDNINYSQTWHRYGVNWMTETELEFYYDGALVRTLDLTQEIVDPSGKYLNKPMRLIMDLEAHAWRGAEGIPSDADLLNSNINNMQIDWVRTYRAMPVSVPEPSSVVFFSAGLIGLFQRRRRLCYC